MYSNCLPKTSWNYLESFEFLFCLKNVYFLILKIYSSATKILHMDRCCHLSHASFEVGVTQSVFEVNADFILHTRLPHRWILN